MSAVRFWSTRSSQNHWRPKQKLGEMFQIFNLLIYFWPFCGKITQPPLEEWDLPPPFRNPRWVVGFFGGVGSFSPSIRGRVCGTLRKPAAVRGVGTTGGARGGQFWRVPWNWQGFFLRKYTMKPLPGDWSSQLVFSKISMGCFGWFFMGWFLVLFSFFMVNEVFGVYFVELVWSNRLRLICYHSGACRFGRWEPPCHAMTASRCSIIRSNSVSLC